MIVNLSVEEIEKQKCQIITSYEKDVLDFWAYVKNSSFPEDIKEELMKKFRIYGIED